MTLQLIEAGLPVILAANLMDEAERLGVQIDLEGLERALGIPVVGTALALGRGTAQLRDTLAITLATTLAGTLATTLAGTLADPRAASIVHGLNCRPQSDPLIQYHPGIEEGLKAIEEQLYGEYQITRRAIGLLLLQNDPGATGLVARQEGARFEAILSTVKATQGRFNRPLSYLVAQQQREAARRLLQPVIRLPERRPSGWAERLSEATMNPLTGIPLLAAALAVLYLFVGVLGAQTLVNFLENSVFGAAINPWIERILAATIPWQALRDLIGGEYGMVTLGVRYAVALILPIVGTFFLAFSIIEDSGYLPRLAMLIDRVFKKIGLNGRAVIPMVLGFGCDTMATIVTRTLETRRERILSTLLLSLAIPCSAQLGVMLAMLAGRPDLLAIWAAMVTGVFLLVGLLAAKLMPGERPTFYMELPPLRLPTPGNVLVKTYTRMEWYFREVFPMFIIASAAIWLGRITGLFDLALEALLPLVRGLGLPDQAAVAFLFGFFRRDYGAAGLYDLRNAMSGAQILVATVTMTLFVPCVAQFSVMLKERGWKMALAIVAFIFPFAFLVGGLLHWLITILGLQL
jgi:ferrous iron transport protein B